MSKSMRGGNYMLPLVSQVILFPPSEVFLNTFVPAVLQRGVPSWRDAADLVSKYLSGYRAVTMQHNVKQRSFFSLGTVERREKTEEAALMPQPKRR